MIKKEYNPALAGAQLSALRLTSRSQTDTYGSTSYIFAALGVDDSLELFLQLAVLIGLCDRRT